jgi:hypothetical protein
MPLAQVRTLYKIGKLNMWTLFCNVCIDFLNSQIWKEISKPIKKKEYGEIKMHLSVSFKKNTNTMNPKQVNFFPQFQKLS